MSKFHIVATPEIFADVRQAINCWFQVRQLGRCIPLATTSTEFTPHTKFVSFPRMCPALPEKVNYVNMDHPSIYKYVKKRH